MSATLSTTHSQMLKINCHDPRGHQAFLQLCNDMHSWQMYASDKSWWLAREKQCIGLFQQYGYDLQSGVWYCLIACQCNGWKGITRASLLLANGFAKQHPPCWPPLAAMEMRRQILDGYCTHLQSLIFMLPEPGDKTKTQQELLNAITLLQRHAEVLQSTQLAAFQQISAWLMNNMKIRETLERSPGRLSVLSAEALPPLFSLSPIPSVRTPWQSKGLWGIAGALIALIIMGVIQGIHEPDVLLFSNRIWPGNPLVVHWQKRLREESDAFPVDNTYEQLSQQLNTLEQRLLDAEQKRKPYLTISELKTDIYKMQQILGVQQKSFELQLNEVQELRKRHQPLSPEILMSLSLKYDALNSRYLLFINNEMQDKI